MSDRTAERLYDLLPAVHRIRDAEQGQPLRALLALMEAQLDAVERDVLELYDDWFIETCEPQLVPYIGDLLGVEPLAGGANGAIDARAYVANTIRYRRRKGTVGVLEALARDVTGWPSHAVELFSLVSLTQHYNHVRPDAPGYVELRDANGLELFGGPFERAPHTLEVRRVAPRRGKYGFANVAIFAWRLQPYTLERVTARALSDPPDGRFTANPLGDDVPLFNPPQTPRDPTDLVTELNVPGALRRRPLFDELEARRQALVDGQTPPARQFGGYQPVVEVFLDGADDPVGAEEITICHLGDAGTAPADAWRRPPATRDYTRSSDATTVSRDIRLALDPRTGRIAFPDSRPAESVEVSFTYAFSADIGGGPYDRQAAVQAAIGDGGVDFQRAVGARVTPIPGEVVATLAEAIADWNASPARVGIISLLDSRTYEEDLVNAAQIAVPAGSRLILAAADWPEVAGVAPPPPTERVRGVVRAAGLRPHLRGELSVIGTDGQAGAKPGELVIDGLLIEGDVTVAPGDLGLLHVADSTIVPGSGALSVEGAAGAGNDRLTGRLERAICGPITLAGDVPELELADAIVDAAGGQAIDAPGAAVHIDRTTVFGATGVRSLEASDAIFTAAVIAERRQVGCVRYSWQAEGSLVPRAFRCQPALALTGIADPAEREHVAGRLRPQFTSQSYGEPAYAQLAVGCAAAIRTGGENGTEMGAFNSRRQPQRAANLASALAEYLRVGLEAGAFFAT